MATSLYMRPDECQTRNGTVATSVGTTDTDYDDAWLVDDRPNRPARATTGTATWTVTTPSQTVGGIVVANHNIDGGRAIAITGGLTAALAGPPARPNGVPLNAWKLIDPPVPGVTSIAVGVASNSVPLIIGELVAGPVHVFPGGGLLLADQSGSQLLRGEAASALSIPRYDRGEAARVWTSSVLGDLTDLDDLMAWFESQRNGARPSVFIPNSILNDAWLVDLQEPQWSLVDNVYKIVLTFQEIPRVRW